MHRESTLTPYIGGKYQLADWIIKQFPPHKAYLEPFGGALNVLFAKQPSAVEVVNDLNDDIFNLWMVVKDHGGELVKRAMALPYSRTLYNEWADEWYSGIKPEDPFERALRYFYICRNSFAGKSRKKSGWSHSISKNQAHSYYKGVESLAWFQERLRNVALEHTDFRTAIAAYDAPKVLMYIDPPYFGKEKYYATKFSEQDHRDLAVLLHDVKSNVAISYYECDEICEMYEENNRWHFNRKFMALSSSGVTGDLRNTNVKKPLAPELLITNYPVRLTLF